MLPGQLALRCRLSHGPQAVAALLDFLPWTEEEDLACEVQQALGVLAVREGGVDAAILRALDDALPVRRAVAAEVLGGIGDAQALAAVSKLLTDSSPAVRMCAAVALLQARDRRAVPALIDLATAAPPEQAWPAEVLLQRLGGPDGPALDSAEDATARARQRDAWKAWWHEHGATVDLTKIDATPTRRAKPSARASGSWEEHTPDRAVSGAAGVMWISGGHAPQWEIGAHPERQHRRRSAAQG